MSIKFFRWKPSSNTSAPTIFNYGIELSEHDLSNWDFNLCILYTYSETLNQDLILLRKKKNSNIRIVYIHETSEYSLVTLFSKFSSNHFFLNYEKMRILYTNTILTLVAIFNSIGKYCILNELKSNHFSTHSQYY